MASAIALPLGLLFFFSGLFINVFQLLSLLVLPFSRRTYRVVNMILMELLWSELVWLVDWWAAVKIHVFADSETMNDMGKEHALVICNHRSDIDWLVGWVLAEHSGCLGGARAVMKKSMKILPVIGWSMWFSEYVFLDRNWSKDEVTLKKGYQRLKDYPRALWVALFVEGTRFTEDKLKAAQEYAESTGIRVPKHVLIPRTKGFVSAVENLRSFVPAIYDVTFAVARNSSPPTVLRLLKGQSSEVHVHIRRILMADLPETEEGIANWCREAFVVKDNLLDIHKKENSFGEVLRQPLRRTIKPLLVILICAAVLLTVAARILVPVLSSWRGVAWFTAILGLISLLMQVLLISSQSERSTRPRPVPRT